jgi:hypothetical protein
MFGASARAPPSPFVAQQGWLVKQGGTRKTWRKRWFVLTDGVLRWYEPGWFTLNPVDGLLKGEVRDRPLRGFGYPPGFSSVCLPLPAPPP